MTLFTIARPDARRPRRRRDASSACAPCGRRSPTRSLARVPRRVARTRRRSELWSALATDGVFRIPAIRLAEAQLAHGAGVDVPVHVGDAGVRRRAAVDARARDPVRVRQPRSQHRGRHRHAGRSGRRSPTRMHRAWIAFAARRRSRLARLRRRPGAPPCASTWSPRSSTTPSPRNAAPGTPQLHIEADPASSRLRHSDAEVVDGEVVCMKSARTLAETVGLLAVRKVARRPRRSRAGSPASPRASRGPARPG